LVKTKPYLFSFVLFQFTSNLKIGQLVFPNLINEHCRDNDNTEGQLLKVRCTLSKVSPFFKVAMRTAPMMVPGMLAIPPPRLAPPITAAAMASIPCRCLPELHRHSSAQLK
jgi:hypothetical protein